MPVPEWKQLRTRDRTVLFIVSGILIVSLIGAVMFLIAAAGHKDYSEVIIAVLGLAGVAVTGYFGYVQATNSQEALAQAERELSFQAASLDFATFLSEWGDTMQDLEKLMAETPVSRFLILRAWNGFLEPRWTTAVLQIRQGEQELVSYVHYELDNDYVARMQAMIRESPLVFHARELPDTASIKRVYSLEKVSEAAWYHLLSQELPGTNSQAITYCSFAVQGDNVFDDHTLTRCSIIASRLKGVAHAFK